MNMPQRTSLLVDNVTLLLATLQGDVDPEELLCVDQVRVADSWRSVHAHVLSWFLCAADQAEADNLFACCKRLIELNAPLTDAYGNGAAAQFTGYPWPLDADQVAQVRELADAYVDAGVWDLDKPMDGDVLTRAERRELDGANYEGLKPLASAIFESNPPLAKYLCDRGASLDLGIVFAGEPACAAIDLALEEGEGEIHAILAEAAMNRFLESGVNLFDPEPIEAAAPPRQRCRAV